MTEKPTCPAMLYMYDGEYEGECQLPEGHTGRHWDGMTSWLTSEYGTVDEDSIENCDSAPEEFVTEKPSSETLRISELIDVLLAHKAKHGDLPVKFTWEGISRDVRAEWVYPSGDGWYEDDEMVLLLDADDGYYKPKFVVSEPTVDEGITTE